MLEASFRGVPFFISNLQYGRNMKAKEAAFTLGKTVAQGGAFDNIDFQIEGFIFGNRSEETKIKLEQALNKQSGILVLPDKRQVRVKIDEGGWRIIKDSQTIDKYKLDFRFKKIDNDSLSLKIVKLKELDGEKLKKKITEAQKSFLAEFNEKFQFQGIKGLIKQQMFDNLVSLASKISKLSADKLLGDAVYPVIGSFDILTATAGTIGATLLSYVNLKDLFGGDKKYLPVYLAMAAADNGLNAAADKTVAANNAAAVDLVKQAAFVNALEEALENTDYADNGDVNRIIKELEDTGRQVIYGLSDRKEQNRLNEILALSAAQIKEKYLNKVKNVKVFESLPAAVLAQTLYGSAEVLDNAEDICRRNGVVHPLFVPAGAELEVLGEVADV